MKEYYGLRRLNPYLGVIQVIDMGEVRAYSTNGNDWRIRRVVEQDEDGDVYEPNVSVGRVQILQAIEQRPALPFPLTDRYELWLLSQRDLLPLALLKSCRWPGEMGPVTDPLWHGFSHHNTGFHVAGLACRSDHRHLLEQLIIDEAYPQPMVQWFERDGDGGGIGRGGLRVDEGLSGRYLRAEQFPALLIREEWDTEPSRLLARGFHDWYAAHLLAHTQLPEPIRTRLEHRLMNNPMPLLECHNLIPAHIDENLVKVAVVAARLMKANKVRHYT